MRETNLLELAFFFIFGYFVGIVHVLVIHKNHVDLKYADKVLTWHPDSFGWRPVFNRQSLQPGKKYLLAFEVYKDEEEVEDGTQG